MPRGKFERKPLGEKTIVPLIRLALPDIADEGPRAVAGLGTRTGTWWRFLQRGGQDPEDPPAFDPGQQAMALTRLSGDAAACSRWRRPPFRMAA